MPIKITGKFEPTNISTDIYPITDSLYNLGGHREVNTILERDSITMLRRREGMTCYVSETKKNYQLINGISNDSWVEVGSNQTQDINDNFKYILQQSDSDVMWGGDAQVWTDNDNNPILYEIKSDKEHIVDLYNNIKQLETQLNNKSYIEITYVDLKILKDNEQLNIGEKYKLIDYRTINDIPNTTVTHVGEIENLILTAFSDKTFEINVYSESYPNDIIRYDFDNNLTPSGYNRTGWIIYRHDTIYNLITYYDFREVTMRRWSLSSNQNWISSTTYSKNDFVTDGTLLYRSLKDNNINNDINEMNSLWWLSFQNNIMLWSSSIVDINGFASLNTTNMIFGTHTDYKTFVRYGESNVNNITITKSNQEVNNIVFFNMASNTTFDNCKNLHIHNKAENNGVFRNVSNSYFSSIEDSSIDNNSKLNYFDNIISSLIKSNFQKNHISYCDSTTIKKNSDFNVIKSIVNSNLGDSFKNNVIISQFSNNIIDDNAENNFFYYITNNTIGDGFNNNIIINCHGNVFGHWCKFNDISRFSYCKIGDSFNYNKTISIDTARENNIILNDFTNNIINTSFNNNNISNNCFFNNFMDDITNNNLNNDFQNNNIYSDFTYNNCEIFKFNELSGYTTSNSFGIFLNNTIKDNFSNNICNGSNMQSNTFNLSFTQNYVQYSLNLSTFQHSSENYFYGLFNHGNNFGMYLEKNRFYSRVINITTLDNFRMNIVNCEINTVNYSSSTHVYTPSGTFLTKTISNSQSTTTPIILTYYDTNNVLQVVNHTS